MKRSDGVESFKMIISSLLCLLKVSPVRAMTAYRGGGGLQLYPHSFLTSVLTGVVSFRPRPLNPRTKIYPVAIKKKSGWMPELIWSSGKDTKLCHQSVISRISNYYCSLIQPVA